ncbi:TetR/AcrR family transcriptional regulator [Nocardia nova]|uniref:TetR/AcrR family transcriptional regulator n=1 Tax=Nocardia nova TaxID=37330 RepID=UPI00046CDE78|nr:TetR/AcrR family transcriptional regulator [Nocardia nova]
MTKTVTKRHRPTQDRARATREHILDTAAQLFGERGIANTSTNRIAAEAEVSIGTVYRYFADRDVIVDELLERMMNNIERRFSAQAARIGSEPLPRLVTSILEALSAELVANAPLVRALAAGLQFYSTGIPDFEPRMRALVVSFLAEVMGPEPSEGTFDLMAYVLVNTGFAAILRTSSPEFDDHMRDQVVAITAEMITAWVEQRSR